MNSASLIFFVLLISVWAYFKPWLRRQWELVLFGAFCLIVPSDIIFSEGSNFYKKVLSFCVVVFCSYFVLFSMRRRGLDDEYAGARSQTHEKIFFILFFILCLLYFLFFELDPV